MEYGHVSKAQGEDSSHSAHQRDLEGSNRKFINFRTKSSINLEISLPTNSDTHYNKQVNFNYGLQVKRDIIQENSIYIVYITLSSKTRIYTSLNIATKLGEKNYIVTLIPV